MLTDLTKMINIIGLKIKENTLFGSSILKEVKLELYSEHCHQLIYKMLGKVLDIFHAI